MFLPLIPAFLGFLATWLAPSGAAGPAPELAALVQGGPVATVVAGTGDPDPDQVAAVRAAVAEQLPKLLPLFDGRPQHPFFVHVHAERDALPDALAAHLHPDSPAFALLGQHQIHVVHGEVRRTATPLVGVVRHELVHELLDQYVAPNGRFIPRWFHEGLAQHLAGDTYLRASEDDLVWLMGTRRLAAFGDLRKQFPLESSDLRTAYAQSYSYVSWLVREYGLDDLLAVARAADSYTSFERALVGRLGRSTLQLEDAWRDYIVHGSGAPWRVLFEQCFSLFLLALLPVLVIALMRRLRSEERAARQLAAAAASGAAMPAEPPPAAAPWLPADNADLPDGGAADRPDAADRPTDLDAADERADVADPDDLADPDAPRPERPRE